MIGREHWRTEKRRDVSGYGKGITSKIEAYIATWQSRCYSDDLPDAIPDELMREGLAPCWRAIAMAILLNRFSLLGIYPKASIFFKKPVDESESKGLF
jgi:hypothetical protein